MWYRIFGRSTNEIKPADVLAHLHAAGVTATARFRGDDLGWTAAEISTHADDSPLMIERYLANEDNLRDDLNTWAGYLETLNYSPHHLVLMERMIQTQQLITIRKPVAHSNEVAIERLCEILTRLFASELDAVYQIDGIGWHDSDGTLLITEY
jgi:hypothetical protein